MLIEVGLRRLPEGHRLGGDKGPLRLLGALLVDRIDTIEELPASGLGALPGLAQPMVEIGPSPSIRSRPSRS